MDKKIDLQNVVEGMVWDNVKKIKIAKKDLKELTEIKGIEIWAPPFNSPTKEVKKRFEAPKNEIFIVHIVTWARKFLVRLNDEKTAVANIAEI